MSALRQELHDLLAPAGILPDLMLKADLPPFPQFSEVVVFEMKGSCTMSAGPFRQESFHKDDLDHASLASAFTSDGQVLHFGEVECDHVRQLLERVTRGLHPEAHQAEYGAALGIVVAHEIYHMIAGTKHHTKEGVTKAALSARDILDGNLAVPAVVRRALRQGS